MWKQIIKIKEIIFYLNSIMYYKRYSLKYYQTYGVFLTFYNIVEKRIPWISQNGYNTAVY